MVILSNNRQSPKYTPRQYFILYGNVKFYFETDWHFTVHPPKFYLPNICTVADLLYKAANCQYFCHQNHFEQQSIHQRFLLLKFCAS